ncbi:hypothetical protein OQA88_5814 [Cercophora sp. LCS_1]
MAHPHPTTPPTLYLNIPTSSPTDSLVFFNALGFTNVPEYSDEQTKSFSLPAPNDSVCVMVHGHSRFKTFMRPTAEIPDAKKTTEVLFSISVKTKEEVDQWLAKAVEAGGEKDPYVMEGYGEACGMYTRSFGDLDGHVWEVCAMIGQCGGQ